MNLELWNKLSKPPLSALKSIEAGRLKGKSDINPQWRLQAITELFGPCGVGWKYEIDKQWQEVGANEEICAFCNIRFAYKTDGEWSEWVPGTGGSMLVAKEKSGLYTSDEAYKMALTDALSVALKSIGVAAEIYLGNFDGSKYKKSANSEPAQLDQTVVTAINAADSMEELAEVWNQIDKTVRSDYTALKDAKKARLA